MTGCHHHYKFTQIVDGVPTCLLCAADAHLGLARPTVTGPITRYLDEVQARADAATPGPWDLPDLNPDPMPLANAIFLARARTDVPRLVAMLRVAVESIGHCYGSCRTDARNCAV